MTNKMIKPLIAVCIVSSCTPSYACDGNEALEVYKACLSSIPKNVDKVTDQQANMLYHCGRQYKEQLKKQQEKK